MKSTKIVTAYFWYLDLDAGTDSDDSEMDDNEVIVAQNLIEPPNNTTIRKSESVKFDVPFNYWKDRDELISM